MPEYDIKTTFEGAISGCYVKHFEAGTTVEINDADLEAVALKEGWIERHVEIEEVDESQFPEDYMLFTALHEIQIPGPDGEPASDIIAVGEQFGMSAAEAQEWIEAGLIAPVETEDGSDPTIPQEAAVPDQKADPEKAAPSAPKNKAAKAAPKAKDTATE